MTRCAVCDRFRYCRVIDGEERCARCVEFIAADYETFAGHVLQEVRS